MIPDSLDLVSHSVPPAVGSGVSLDVSVSLDDSVSLLTFSLPIYNAIPASFLTILGLSEIIY